MMYRPFGGTEELLPQRAQNAAPELEPMKPRVVEVPEPPSPALPRLKASPLTVGPKARKAGAKAVDLLVMNGVTHTFAAGLIEWLLQEACGKKDKPDAAPKTVDDELLDDLMREYRRLHRTATGDDPHLLKGDVVIAQRLLKKFGLKTVVSQLQTLATIPDSFIRQQGLTFTVVQRHWSRILAAGSTQKRVAAVQAPDGCRHTPRCMTMSEHTRRYLADANGASR